MSCTNTWQHGEHSNTDLQRQCAAVRTQSLAIRVPPQRCLLPFLRDTSHGNSPWEALTPPTILAPTRRLETPHSVSATVVQNSESVLGCRMLKILKLTYFFTFETNASYGNVNDVHLFFPIPCCYKLRSNDLSTFRRTRLFFLRADKKWPFRLVLVKLFMYLLTLLNIAYVHPIWKSV